MAPLVAPAGVDIVNCPAVRPDVAVRSRRQTRLSHHAFSASLAHVVNGERHIVIHLTPPTSFLTAAVTPVWAE
jgi:hypothetical protein